MITRMSDGELATILKEALEEGDIDAVWFVVGELEKGATK